MAQQHTPTAAQLAQLATLQTALTAANATQASSFTTYAAAQKAALQAAVDLNNYRAFIYGETSKPGTISSSPDET